MKRPAKPDIPGVHLAMLRVDEEGDLHALASEFPGFSVKSAPDCLWVYESAIDSTLWKRQTTVFEGGRPLCWIYATRYFQKYNRPSAWRYLTIDNR